MASKMKNIAVVQSSHYICSAGLRVYYLQLHGATKAPQLVDLLPHKWKILLAGCFLHTN